MCYQKVLFEEIVEYSLAKSYLHSHLCEFPWKLFLICLIYRTASQIHLMKFSPDGEFFATAGKVIC